MAKKFPKTVFVTRDNEGTSGEYLSVDEELNGKDDGKVAVYTLTEIIDKRTATEIRRPNSRQWIRP